MIQSEHSVDQSSILGYHIGDGVIIVIFTTGYGYLYNSVKPGLTVVNKMIELAKQGANERLGEYITRNARGNYYQKLQ